MYTQRDCVGGGPVPPPIPSVPSDATNCCSTSSSYLHTVHVQSKLFEILGENFFCRMTKKPFICKAPLKKIMVALNRREKKIFPRLSKFDCTYSSDGPKVSPPRRERKGRGGGGGEILVGRKVSCWLQLHSGLHAKKIDRCVFFFCQFQTCVVCGASTILQATP